MDNGEQAYGRINTSSVSGDVTGPIDIVPSLYQQREFTSKELLAGMPEANNTMPNTVPPILHSTAHCKQFFDMQYPLPLPTLLTDGLPLLPPVAIAAASDRQQELSAATADYVSKPKRRKETAATTGATTGEESATTDAAKTSTDDKLKGINYMRKNIRDVMDEHQLDADTLVAQREESERLARVADQQRLIREYQRQTAAQKRTQSKVMSLLRNSDTYKEVYMDTEAFNTNSTEDNCFPEVMGMSVKSTTTTEAPISESSGELLDSADMTPKTSAESNTADLMIITSTATPTMTTMKTMTTTTTTTTTPESSTEDATAINEEVVTIEDSSSEEDCIVLSDDGINDLDDDDEDDEDSEDEVDEPEYDPNNSGLHVKDSYNVPDEQGRVVVNVGHPEGEENIYVAPQIARVIKPHQIGGVRFLFDNIIESTKRFETSSGFGCILAHSMGLGKTLQVVCFCDIFLRNTPSKTILCVMPINTLQNWCAEFDMWTPRETMNPDYVRPRLFNVFVLNDQQKTLSSRGRVVLQWAHQGGVLLIGYELFRLLALKMNPSRKKRGTKNHLMQTEMNDRLIDSIHQALVKPGPDLVICDEGHRIKNANAGISLALKQIRTKRRVVLTGYPLQNNLTEYWCMVDFVRPNYLGTRSEFCNMFERPILNGQCVDSTPEDIKLMRYRAHVLHSLLMGFVQRRSHVVLQQTLPQKLEFVILTRMTSFQRQLYQNFMNGVVRSKTVPNPLKAFAICCKIWNHPDVLYNFLKKHETDLELEEGEIPEEGEIIQESTQYDRKDLDVKKENAETTLAVTTTPSDVNQSKVAAAITNEVLPKTEDPIKKNGGEMQVSSALSEHTDQSSSDLRTKTMAGGLNESLDNVLGENYYNCNPPSYPIDCETNNFWQEPNVPYFIYKNLSTIGNSSNECQPKAEATKLTPIPEKTAQDSIQFDRSSEIVDLDTNEIKTCETIIESNRDTNNERIKNSGAEMGDNSVVDNDKQKRPNDQCNSYSIKSDGVKANFGGVSYRWALDLFKTYEPECITNSPKMEILFCILEESIRLGDRVLLFSQSLLTLNLIEYFLQTNVVPQTSMHWCRNRTYFRLDGTTTSQEREKLVNEFNANTDVKLFLISTRAGSLGINLIGANRVVVFDASWNPCHDTQAVYRIYRYGQKKLCYIYRLVMDKCMEKKIYDRQIKKQGMSDRVVDECNPESHLSMKDITNLCRDFDYEDGTEENNAETPVEISKPIDSYQDHILQTIIESHKACLSKEPFLHESLLVDKKEKRLSQAEKRQAHRGYEIEKKATIKQTFIAPANRSKDYTLVKRPVASIRPMQMIKSNTSGGVRSTRWIPAEVWQRQGMTAQEMTLPLDVVIPTNNNEKTNIVLKAGQRVMVLKSTKGIYMQLDSGKIIAIRTSSKVTEEASTPNKDEVIDITSEDDVAQDDAQDESNASGGKSQLNFQQTLIKKSQEELMCYTPEHTTSQNKACNDLKADNLQKNRHMKMPSNTNSQDDSNQTTAINNSSATNDVYQKAINGGDQSVIGGQSFMSSLLSQNSQQTHNILGNRILKTQTNQREGLMQSNKTAIVQNEHQHKINTAMSTESNSSATLSSHRLSSIKKPDSVVGHHQSSSNCSYSELAEAAGNTKLVDNITSIARAVDSEELPKPNQTPAWPLSLAGQQQVTSKNTYSSGNVPLSMSTVDTVGSKSHQSSTATYKNPVSYYTKFRDNAASGVGSGTIPTSHATASLQTNTNYMGRSIAQHDIATKYPHLQTHQHPQNSSTTKLHQGGSHPLSETASSMLPVSCLPTSSTVNHPYHHSKPSSVDSAISQQHPSTHHLYHLPSTLDQQVNDVRNSVHMMRSSTRPPMDSGNKQQLLTDSMLYTNHHHDGTIQHNYPQHNYNAFCSQPAFDAQSAGCNYSQTAVNDYSTAAALYGSYGHPHPQYHSNLHSNTYGNMISSASAAASTMASNPYAALHWSPLISAAGSSTAAATAAAADKYNSMYPPPPPPPPSSAAYSQNNSFQANPWHNP